MKVPKSWLVVAVVVVLEVTAGTADAYIGPGAGFALGGSMLILLATFVLAFAPGRGSCHPFVANLTA